MYNHSKRLQCYLTTCCLPNVNFAREVQKLNVTRINQGNSERCNLFYSEHILLWWTAAKRLKQSKDVCQKEQSKSNNTSVAENVEVEAFYMNQHTN